ncbi:MAG TPA: ATP synthase F0 subunit C [Pyrinomonadaceae bacterium]|nr:ATP synthase F0 subunit C [Pyrinomonadaceae bacterium]
MSKLRIAFFAVVGVLASAAPALAQGAAAADNVESTNKFKALAAGLGFALAAALAAIGQSRVAAAAAEGVARNPGAGARIQTMMILGLVFIETLVLFTLVVVFAKL